MRQRIANIKSLHAPTWARTSKVVTDRTGHYECTGVHDYMGSVEYENREQEAYYTDEGRVNLTPTYYNRHEYTLKDHLGNGRYWFCDWAEESTFAPQNLQTANYYAYGLPYAVPPSSPPTERNNKYQYNGIELIDDFGLQANHALYRTLDPQLGKWWQIDPKAEEFYGWSGYHSNLGNPVLNVDTKGDTPDNYYRNKDGDLVAVVRTKDNSDTFYTIKDDNTVTNNGSRTKDEGWSRLTDDKKNNVVNRVAAHEGKAESLQVNGDGLTLTQQKDAKELIATSGSAIRGADEAGTPIVSGAVNRNESPVVGVYSTGSEQHGHGSLTVTTASMPVNPGGFAGEVPQGILPTPAIGDNTQKIPAGSLPPNQTKPVGRGGGSDLPMEKKLTDKNGNLIPKK